MTIDVAEVLRRARTIAVLGAHREPSKPAFYVPEYLASQGYEPLAANGAQFAKIIREGSAKWERVVRERNIKVE